MPPLYADPDEWVGTAIAVVLLLTRLWLLRWTWLDHQWVKRAKIRNGRKIISESQYKIQSLRVVADLVVLLFEVLALLSPDPVDPSLLYNMARVGRLILPAALLLATLGEARMRRRLFRH